MAESSVNHAGSETTKVFPFFDNIGFNPRLDFTLLPMRTSTAATNLETFAHQMMDVHNQLRTEIRFSHDQYQYYANTSRIPARVTKSETKYGSTPGTEELPGPPENYIGNDLADSRSNHLSAPKHKN